MSMKKTSPSFPHHIFCMFNLLTVLLIFLFFSIMVFFPFLLFFFSPTLGNLVTDVPPLQFATSNKLIFSHVSNLPQPRPSLLPIKSGSVNL